MFPFWNCYLIILFSFFVCLFVCFCLFVGKLHKFSKTMTTAMRKACSFRATRHTHTHTEVMGRSFICFFAEHWTNERAIKEKRKKVNATEKLLLIVEAVCVCMCMLFFFFFGFVIFFFGGWRRKFTEFYVFQRRKRKDQI